MLTSIDVTIDVDFRCKHRSMLTSISHRYLAITRVLSGYLIGDNSTSPRFRNYRKTRLTVYIYLKNSINMGNSNIHRIIDRNVRS